MPDQVIAHEPNHLTFAYPEVTSGVYSIEMLGLYLMIISLHNPIESSENTEVQISNSEFLS